MYLLDKAVWVALLRDRDEGVRSSLAAKPRASAALCSVVLYELMHGALESARPEENAAAIQNLASKHDVLPFDSRAAQQAAAVRASLERTGQCIGLHDVMIAATALSLGATLVTHNVREFSRVPGLNIEDWQTGERSA